MIKVVMKYFILEENQELWDKFNKIKESTGTNKSTIAQYKYAMLSAELLVKKPLTQLTNDDVEELAETKRKNYKSLLNGFFVTCINNDLIHVTMELLYILVPSELKYAVAKMYKSDTTNTFKKDKRFNSVYTYNGEELPLSEISFRYRISKSTIYDKLDRGFSIAQIIEDNYKAKNKEIEYKGVKYKTKKELCEKYNINVSTFSYRIKNGQSISDALEVPTAKYKKSKKWYESNGQD